MFTKSIEFQKLNWTFQQQLYKISSSLINFNSFGTSEITTKLIKMPKITMMKTFVVQKKEGFIMFFQNYLLI